MNWETTSGCPNTIWWYIIKSNIIWVDVSEEIKEENRWDLDEMVKEREAESKWKLDKKMDNNNSKNNELGMTVMCTRDFWELPAILKNTRRWRFQMKNGLTSVEIWALSFRSWTFYVLMKIGLVQPCRSARSTLNKK